MGKATEIEKALEGLLDEGDYAFIVAGDGSHFTHFAKPFKFAYQEGKLQPENTFPLVLMAYGHFQVSLALLDDAMQGHMATCMPEEFQQMVQQRIQAAQAQAREGSGLILPDHLKNEKNKPS